MASVGTTASSLPHSSTGAPSTTAAAVTMASSPPTPSTVAQSSTAAVGTTASSPPPSSTGAQSSTAAVGTTASSPPPSSTGAPNTTAAAVTTASSPPTPFTEHHGSCSYHGNKPCYSLHSGSEQHGSCNHGIELSYSLHSGSEQHGSCRHHSIEPSSFLHGGSEHLSGCRQHGIEPCFSLHSGSEHHGGCRHPGIEPSSFLHGCSQHHGGYKHHAGSAGTTVTKGPTNPCQEDSCKGGSSCVSLNDTFFCLCPEGQYYNSSTCSKGKIFPGTITFKTSNIEDLKDENSVAYQKLHFEITEFFKKAFNNSDYGQTVIVKISLRTSAARSELRAGDKDVDIEVVNIFKETTELNETTVSNAITKAIEDNADVFTGYTEQDRCDYYGCEKKNDQDNCSSGLLCQCKQGLVRPNPQIPMCVAFGPTCDDTCNAENKRQCLVRSSTSADCVCLPGYREDSHGACQPCAFGYSGVGCKDNFQLILTIVGTIAGILILGVVTAFIFSIRLKIKGKNMEEQNLVENEFQNLRLQEMTSFSNLGADGSIFPKVSLNLSEDSQPQGPYANLNLGAHGSIFPRVRLNLSEDSQPQGPYGNLNLGAHGSIFPRVKLNLSEDSQPQSLYTDQASTPPPNY
ncbi:mucin-13-like [Camelus ferus]|uniref:Mucin-13-like n=1 Tax=Camelus ferus TaxID=419612 RepID=A0A8B8T5E3_CAMFR|nr:mucin-13-like [Camelus ferus]